MYYGSKWTSLLYQLRVRCSSEGKARGITSTPEVDTIMMSIWSHSTTITCTIVILHCTYHCHTYNVCTIVIRTMYVCTSHILNTILCISVSLKLNTLVNLGLKAKSRLKFPLDSFKLVAVKAKLRCNYM